MKVTPKQKDKIMTIENLIEYVRVNIENISKEEAREFMSQHWSHVTDPKRYNELYDRFVQSNIEDNQRKVRHSIPSLNY